MDDTFVFAKDLTRPDHIVLSNLARHVQSAKKGSAEQVLAESDASGSDSRTDSATTINRRITGKDSDDGSCTAEDDAETIERLKSFNDPSHPDFDHTLFLSFDLHPSQVSVEVNKYILQPYIRWARKLVRHEADIVMLSHLILYFTTSVPSAIILYNYFTYLHGIFHVVMQVYYTGTYTLMMHQHIHMRGILAKKYAFFDNLFPYITDPLMGHTWNTYFYHHVKHHHVEGNGPDDLSSTIRYQRDSFFHFLHYFFRFFFLIWLDLPLYFMRKNKPGMAVRAGGSELLTLAFYATAAWFNLRPTIFVFLVPMLLLRIGLMVGNWGQHALVDDVDPDSDFRSSITLVDASNRYCFNDGYHTSHHLNPLRHWRQHPVSLLEQKQTYAKEGALVFHNIDYIMLTVNLLCKNYEQIAKCLVPINDQQMKLTMDGRVELLKKLTRRFTEEEIRQKFSKAS